MTEDEHTAGEQISGGAKNGTTSTNQTTSNRRTPHKHTRVRVRTHTHTHTHARALCYPQFLTTAC